MRFWRIYRQRFSAQAASGEGARLYGGRWNSRGVSVVYASTSLALAALETFVHLEPNLQPDDLVFIAGDIPDDLSVERLELHQLPAHWRKSKDESLRRLGDAWVRSARSLALLVPSAVIAGEWNILLNPAHPDFPRVQFHSPQRFEFDARMFR